MSKPLTPPFHVEELQSAFKVVDSAGMAICYVYWRENDLVGTSDRLSRDEAFQVARWIASLGKRG